MNRLLLVEDVFLLGHDDDSGRNTASLGLPGALAGALLLDLAEQDVVRVEADDVHPTGNEPSHPLLRRAAAALREQEKTRSVSWWLARLPRELKPLDRSIGESLVERGILGEEQGKVLGIFSSTRWPELDPAPERALRAELRDALLGTADPSTRVLLLIGLLHHQGMVDGLVDKPDRKRARRRAGELVKIAESSDAISEAIGDSARAATMTAITTATMAATTAAMVSSN